MHRILIFIFLFSWISLQSQNVCNLGRYVNDIFTVQLTQEPALYGTATTWQGNTENLSFDFYEPAGDTLTKRPLIIMAFGGSFLGGSKRQGELVDYCEAMTRKGFCVASIDYRVGFNIFSTSSAVRAVYRGYQDMAAAVRYFRQFAGTYDIDPNQIYGGGNSSGAINALHAAYGDDADRVNIPSNILEPTFDNPDLGCPDCSGNTYAQFREPNAVINLWGAIGEDFWIEAGEAPVISFHGTSDNVIDINFDNPYNFPVFPAIYGSNLIHAQASSEGIVEEIHIFNGGGHELWDNASNMQFIIDESSDFLFTNMLKPISAGINGSISVCANSIETYCVTAPLASSKYCWTVTNGTIIADNNDCITIQWNASGVASLEFIERTCHDAEGDPVSSVISIDPSGGPTAAFNFGYLDAGINFGNTSLGGVSYFWDFGDGTTSSLVNPSHVYAANGNYTVSLTVTDPFGCVSTTTQIVHQFCQPTWVIGANPTPTGLYQTFNWVESSNPVASGSNVSFKAGDFIELLTGFEVNVTDDFLAEIVPCTN